jgi:hypothetical protein
MCNLVGIRVCRGSSLVRMFASLAKEVVTVAGGRPDPPPCVVVRLRVDIGGERGCRVVRSSLSFES